MNGIYEILNMVKFEILNELIDYGWYILIKLILVVFFQLGRLFSFERSL